MRGAYVDNRYCVADITLQGNASFVRSRLSQTPKIGPRFSLLEPKLEAVLGRKTLKAKTLRPRIRARIHAEDTGVASISKRHSHIIGISTGSATCPTMSREISATDSKAPQKAFRPIRDTLSNLTFIEWESRLLKYEIRIRACECTDSLKRVVP